MGWLNGVLTGLTGAVAAYILLAALITIFQRRLIYNPDPRRTTPEACGLAGIAVVGLDTADGERLTAWHLPAAPGYPTLLYFHGNAGWIELRADRLADLTRRGFGVLMPSYRGYGGSTGKPTEANNDADARLAYDWLREQGVGAGDIIVFGESLGTGVATKLAGVKNCAGLILDSPYTSMLDLARASYPWLPIRRLLRDRYETIRHIKRVTVPVLVLHGEADRRVPVAMGLAVHDAVLAPAQLIVYPGAAHLDHRRYGSFDDVDRWLRQLPGRKRHSSRQTVLS